MTHLHQVEKWARILERITAASLIAIPGAIIAGLLMMPITPDALGQMMDGLTVSQSATSFQIYLAIGINLIPTAILLFTLNKMRQLFGAYRQSQVLTERCALLIQRIGQGFLMLALAPLILHPMLSLLLSLANPPGERLISISLSSEMYVFAAAGGLIIIVGWAMREASELASENRAFV